MPTELRPRRHSRRRSVLFKVLILACLASACTAPHAAVRYYDATFTAEVRANDPTIRIELSGHTDSRGTDESNQRLSESRAKACVDYLVAHGIKLDRLEFKGYGEAKPIDTNETEAGMANNRRTEFKILSK